MRNTSIFKGALALTSVLALSLAACSQETQENAADTLDSAGEDIQDNVDVTERTLEGAADDAGDAISGAAEEAADVIGEKTEEAGRAMQGNSDGQDDGGDK